MVVTKGTILGANSLRKTVSVLAVAYLLRKQSSIQLLFCRTTGRTGGGGREGEGGRGASEASHRW